MTWKLKVVDMDESLELKLEMRESGEPMESQQEHKQLLERGENSPPKEE